MKICFFVSYEIHFHPSSYFLPEYLVKSSGRVSLCSAIVVLTNVTMSVITLRIPVYPDHSGKIYLTQEAKVSIAPFLATSSKALKFLFYAVSDRKNILI